MYHRGSNPYRPKGGEQPVDGRVGASAKAGTVRREMNDEIEQNPAYGT